MEKVIIFGASNLGNIAYNVLKDKYDICFFSDNGKNKWDKEFCGLKIIKPTDLLKYADYKIIIASMYYSEISVQLKNMNLKKIYVFSYCDANDKTFKKRYSIDKIADINMYKDIETDKILDENYIDKINPIYNKHNKNLTLTKEKQISKKYKKVLVVSYIFPPIGGGGVQRTLKFVKYLKNYGWEPIVLTVGKDFWYDNKDYSLMEDIPKDIQVIKIDHNIFSSEQLNSQLLQELISLYYGIINDKEIINKYLEYISENEYSNRKDILVPDICITWVNEVLKIIDNAIDFDNIDLIYTTSCPYSDHILGYFLKKIYDLPWVADFRDEWTNHAYLSEEYKKSSLKYEFERKMEENIVRLADKVLTVTPICSRNYINNFNIENDKIVTITNGYDEDDFLNIKDDSINNKFTLVFNGSLYKEINPINILLAVNNLIEKNKIKKQSVEMELIGTVCANIKEALLKCDKYGIIRYLGYLPHNSSLKLTSTADMLMLILGKDKKVKSVYTGKIFEYLRLYKPIVSLSPKGSLVEQLLDITGTGKNFEYDNINGIELYILENYNKWLINDSKLEVNKSEVEKYERKNLTKKLSEVFNNLIKNN